MPTVEEDYNVQDENVPMSNDDGYDGETVLQFNDDGELVPVSEMVVDGDEQGQPEAVDESADNSPTPTDYYKSQEEVNAAFNARFAAERKKYQADVDLSNRVRTLFNGMSDEEISAKLTSTAAEAYAKEKNIPQNVATELLDLRVGQRMQASPVDDVPDQPPVAESNEHDPSPVSVPDTKVLADEIDDINAKYGVNLLETLSRDKDIARAVLSGEMDLRDLLVKEVMSRNGSPSTPTRRVGPTKTPNGAGSIYDSRGYLSDAAYKQIDAALERGESVRF